MKRILSLLLALLIGPLFAEEATPPKADASPLRKSGKIAEGTDWETSFAIVDSGKPGPTVLIVGGMHGNEPAGSLAAGQILHWPIVRGKLVVIPRANVLALQANLRLTPGAPEEAANLNRNFPPVSEEVVDQVQPRGELAKALWQFAIKQKPDWVLDLHEGYEFHISHQPAKGKGRSVGSSIIYQGSEKLDGVAKQVVAAANQTVEDPNRKFSLIRRGPVFTGLARACINVMGAEGIILETTYNHQPMSIRTRQHRAMVNVLLNHIGLIDSDCSERIASPKSEGHLQIAVFDGKGTGPSRIALMEAISSAENVTVHHVGTPEMKQEILDQFDVVVFPGGSASRQAKDMGEPGRSAVRDFVKNGGGYLGVCAGAYLCSASYPWSLNLVDSRPLTGKVEGADKSTRQLWYRGKEASIAVELNEKGEALFGSKGIPKQFEVRYANGPIISPYESDTIDDYEVLAWYRSENGYLEQQKGTMINTPAIVSSRVGKGRVISVSQHPELNSDLHPIITQAVQWVAGRIEVGE